MKIVNDITPDIIGGKVQREERKAPAEYHIIGSQRRVPGHTLFAFDQRTRTWKVADLRREVAVGMDGKPISQNKVSIEPGVIYIQALNLENAKRKYAKAVKRYIEGLTIRK